MTSRTAALRRAQAEAALLVAQAWRDRAHRLRRAGDTVGAAAAEDLARQAARSHRAAEHRQLPLDPPQGG